MRKMRHKDNRWTAETVSIGLTVLFLAMLLFLYSRPAHAADLAVGGNCCSDLEERIADLEATAAKKGNRKVALTIYGTVNEAILFASQDGVTAHAIGTNTIDPSRFGFTGAGKVGGGFTAGFRLEVGIGSLDELVVRESNVFLDTPAGRFTIGRTTTATKDIAAISTANTVVASKLLSAAPFVDDLAFSGGRANVVRYDSPTLLGFVASASWASSGSWDAALRWSGEALGFKAAAGAGYAYSNALGVDIETVSGSVSLMHVESGLFVSGAAGSIDPRHFDVHATTWQVQGGMERKWINAGATTLFAEYGQGQASITADGFTAAAETLRFYGAGGVQRVDAAALDLYVSWRRYDAGDVKPLDTVLAGARIQF